MLPREEFWRVHGRTALAVLAGGALVATAFTVLGVGVPVRAGVIGGICLLLWLTERVAVWVPTVLLLASTPLLIGTIDGRFALAPVLGWSIDPVLALFLGGFALAAAAHRHGVDRALAGVAVRLADGSPARLVAAAAVSTALLSMWMSNVAAAALMLGAFRPIWGSEPAGSALRRSLLLGIALAADVGGIATPIGTGPNGIAMAAVAHIRPISFLHWMVFGVPLTFALLAAALVLILVRLRPSAPVAGWLPAGPAAHARMAGTGAVGGVALPLAEADLRAPDGSGAAGPPYRRFGTIFGLTVLLWLTEPVHDVPAWMIALGAVVALLATRVLGFRDLVRLDWGTLLLVAGGITLGALLDTAGLVREFAAIMPLDDAPATLRLFVLCLLSAGLSALMSNTGTAALLIPLAMSLDPAPSTAIIVAVASSLGLPFVVSTPPNAMAVAGGLRSSDLLFPGLILMFGGCVIVAVTGPWVLRAVGIP